MNNRKIFALLVCALLISTPISATNTQNTTPNLPPDTKQTVMEFNLNITETNGTRKITLQPFPSQQVPALNTSGIRTEKEDHITPAEFNGWCIFADYLNLRQLYTDTISPSGDTDWVYWYLPSRGRLTVNLGVPWNKNYDLEVYTSCWSGYACQSRNGKGKDEQCVISDVSGSVMAKIYGSNGASGPESYSIKGTFEDPRPDLVINSLSTNPDSLTDKTSFSLRFVAANNGLSNAGPFRTQIYVNGNEWTYCTYYNGLSSMNSAPCSWNGLVWSAGNYRIKAFIDSLREVDEKDESNNDIVSIDKAVQITQKPDIIMDPITIRPSSVEEGSSFLLNVSLRNAASTRAGSFYVNILVNDADWSSCYFSNGLEAQYSGWCTWDYLTWSAGNYRIKAIANKNRQVDESEFGNNEAYQSITITPVRSDVYIWDLSISPFEIEDSKPFTVQYTIYNQGKKDAGPFPVKFYIDGTPRFTCSVPGLSKGQYYTCKPPSSYTLPSGVHSLLVYADPDNTLNEPAWENNYLSREITVKSIPKPDVYVWDVSLSSFDLDEETPFSVQYTIHNQGSGAAGNFVAKFYIDNAHKFNCVINGIPAGEYTTCRPLTTYTYPAGIYELQFNLDPDNKLSETQRGNNLFKKNITIKKILRPDLYIKNTVVSPETPMENTPFKIIYTTGNKGSGTAGKFDTTLSINGITRHICTFDSLTTDESRFCTLINIRLSAGEYPIRIEADPAQQINDYTRENNIKSFSQTIRPRIGPDLVPYGISLAPTTPTGDEFFALSYRTANLGNTAASSFVTKLIILNQNQDQVFSQSCLYKSLNPGMYNSCDPYISLPTGSYTAKIIVDTNNEIVNELDEENNNNAYLFQIGKNLRLDLIPLYFSTQPATLLAEEPFTTRFEIHNKFSSPVPPVIAYFLINDIIIASCTWNNGIPKDTIGICNISQLQTSQGLRKFSVIVDPDQKTLDINRSNNILTLFKQVGTRSLPKPDLIIDSLWADGTLQKFQTGKFLIKIQNTGSPAQPSIAKILIDGNIKATISVPALGFLQSARLEAFVNDISQGQHRVRATADADNLIDEANESNNILERDFSWAGSLCTIPDGTSESCDCDTASDCPTSHLFCEEQFPSPISDGPDACLSQRPLYCGDGICNGAESFSSCPNDCVAPEANLFVTVTGKSQPLEGALVLAGSKTARTDGFGKAVLRLWKDTSYQVSVDCPSSIRCNSQKVVIGSQDRYLPIDCPCTRTDSDGDSYKDDEERVVGTNPLDPQSNLGSSLPLFDNNLNSCLMGFPIGFGLFSKEDGAQFISTFKDESPQVWQTKPQLVGKGSTLMHAFEQAEQVQVITSGGHTIIVTYDESTGSWQSHYLSPRCVGGLIGIFHGAGKGGVDDIKAIPDVLLFIPKLIMSSIAYFIEIMKGKADPINAMIRLWEQLDVMIAQVGTQVYEGALGIFDDGKGISGFLGYETQGADFHTFQIAYFKGRVLGYTVEQIGTSLIGVGATAKVVKAISTSMKLGRVLTPIERLIMSLERFGDPVQSIAKQSRIALTVASWGDATAETGFGWLIKFLPEGTNLDKAIGGVKDFRGFFTRISRLGKEIGPELKEFKELEKKLLSRLSGKRFGNIILEKWPVDDLKRFEKVLETFDDTQIDELARIVGDDVDRLKDISLFLHAPSSPGQGRLFRDTYSISQKIAKNNKALRSYFGTELDDVLKTADDWEHVAKGSDLALQHAKEVEKIGGSLKNIGKTQKIQFIKNIGKILSHEHFGDVFIKNKFGKVVGSRKMTGAEVADALSQFQDAPWAYSLSKQIVDSGNGAKGYAFEIIKALELRKKGMEITSIDFDIVTALGKTDIDAVYRDPFLGKKFAVEIKNMDWAELKEKNIDWYEKEVRDLDRKLKKYKQYIKEHEHDLDAPKGMQFISNHEPTKEILDVLKILEVEMIP